jgi:hypothetical protein
MAEAVIENEGSNPESIVAKPSDVQGSKSVGGDEGSAWGNDAGYGVGMLVRAEEGAKGDEVYMPVPDIHWYF